MVEFVLEMKLLNDVNMEEKNMGDILLVAIFFAIFAIFDAVRRMNHNILNQTEEIKKLREVLAEKSEK